MNHQQNRFLMVVVSLFLGAQVAWAATIQISPGETITLRATEESTVTCGGSGTSSDCESATQFFEFKMNTCMNHGYGFTSCLNSEWGPYKRDNPHCIQAAIPFCITKCMDSGYGYTSCNNSCR